MRDGIPVKIKEYPNFYFDHAETFLLMKKEVLFMWLFFLTFFVIIPLIAGRVDVVILFLSCVGGWLFLWFFFG